MHLGFFFWVSINTDSLASKGYKGEGGNLIKTDSIAKRDIKGKGLIHQLAKKKR